jgi:peptidyl-prolyl cis-trans isomerase C
MNRKFSIGIVFLAVGMCLFLMACQETKSPEKTNQQIIAMVNNNPLTARHLQHELVNVFLAYGQDLSDDMTEEQATNVELQAIQNLINTELLVNEAIRRGLSVSDTAIKQRIESLRSRYSSPEVLMLELELRDLTLDDLHEEARRSLLVEKLVSQVFKPLDNMNEETMKKIFHDNIDRFRQPEAVHLSQIMILVFDEDSLNVRNNKKQQLTKIRNRVLNGEDFGELAFRYSDCPSGRKQGEIGWITREMIASELVDTAFTLKPGSVSEIVETESGFHLLRLNDFQPVKIPDYETDQEEIRQIVIEDQKRVLMQNLVNRLYEEASIEIPGYR